MKKLFVLFLGLSLLVTAAEARSGKGGGDVESSNIIDQLTGLTYFQKADENGNYDRFMTVSYTTGGCRKAHISYNLKVDNLTLRPIAGGDIQYLDADVSISVIDDRDRNCRMLAHVTDTVNLTKLLAEKAAELNLRKRNTQVTVTFKTVPVVTRELLDNTEQ